MKLTGAEILSRSLQKLGVKYVFGSPGTTELSILDSILRNSDINYFITLHESVCIGMADGFARASGMLGVANVHATQGTLNAAGYIRAANRDNSSVLIIAGAPSLSYAIHEPNHFVYGLVDITRHITKWSWEVRHIDEVHKAIYRAATIAVTQPKGPTYVAIPQDILTSSSESVDFEETAPFVGIQYRGDASMILRAAQILLNANLPLIFAGNGVGWTGAVDDLVVFAETINAPVISEALDRGPMIHSVNFPGDHPLFIGYFDSRDAVIQNLLQESDVIVFIGTKATYSRVLRFKFGSAKRVIQIDVNPAEIAKNHKVDIAIVGNISDILRELTSIVESSINKKQKRVFHERFNNIRKISASIKKDQNLCHIGLDNAPITPKQLVKALKLSLHDRCIIVDDSQCISYYLKKYYEFRRPKSLFGSMASHLGWAFPASLGIQLASNDHKVVCTVSDASFIFSLQALATASTYNIPVTIVVCNNQGFMSLKLELSQYKTKGHTEKSIKACDLSKSNFDLARVADAFGIHSETVDEPSKLVPVLQRGVESNEPMLINVLMTTEMKEWSESWYTPAEDIV